MFLVMLADGSYYTASETVVYRNQEQCEQVMNTVMPSVAQQTDVLKVHAACVRLVFGQEKSA